LGANDGKEACRIQSGIIDGCMNMSPAYQPASHTSAPGEPDVVVSAQELFKIDTNLQVPAFSAPEEHVPPLDPDYVFDRDTTLALLAGFVHNRRVMVQGRHGTGKSSHVEQVASRLNWPCVRVNLDGHVSRIDRHREGVASATGCDRHRP
jgi:cobaltochelatase CobS